MSWIMATIFLFYSNDDRIPESKIFINLIHIQRGISMIKIIKGQRFNNILLKVTYITLKTVRYNL